MLFETLTEDDNWVGWLFELKLNLFSLLVVGEDGNDGNDGNRMSGSKGCLVAFGGLFSTGWLILFDGELDTDWGEEGADAGDL